MNILISFNSHIALYIVLLGFIASPWQPLSASWQPSVVVSNPTIANNTLSGPVLDVNSQGNAIAVFVDRYSTTFPDENAISSSFYTRGSGWSNPQIISSLALNSFNSPLYEFQGDVQVSMNSSNYAVAVWEGTYNDEPFYRGVFATTRASNGIWGSVQPLSTPSFSLPAVNINVAVNEIGTAVAAYRSLNTSTYKESTLVTILPYGGSWSAPLAVSSIEESSGNNINKPWVAINAAGDIVVIWWRAISSNFYGIDVATYNAGTSTWTPPVTLDSYFNPGVDQNPRCAINDNGNAVAIWLNSNKEVRSSFFTPSGGWSASNLLDSNGGNAPTVILDAMGNATATWPSSSVPGIIYSSYKPFGSAWSLPIEISTGIGNMMLPFESQTPLAVDPDGNVMAVWTDVNLNVVSSYRLFQQPWQAPEIVFNRSNNIYPSVGLASCGFAVALWLQAVGPNGTTMAAVNENILTPFNLTKTNCTQIFATQKAFLNIFNWGPLPAPCILKYSIYCNGILIGETSSTDPLQFIYSRNCRGNCNFTITSTNIWGYESDPVPFN